MSLIPQLMSGRKLEHDLKFASDGPISGLVEGVQSETLAATSTFVLKETTTANEFQMKANTLSLDPGGASRSVNLPAAITDGPDLAGRRIVIRNASDQFNENLTIYESDGTTFVAFVGFDQCVEIFFTAQGKPFVVNDLFCAAGKDLAGDAVTLVPALGSAYISVPEYAVLIGDGCDQARTWTLTAGGGTVAVSEAETLASKAMVLQVGVNGTAAATQVMSANSVISIDADGDPATDAADGYLARVYFRVFKADVSTPALAALS
tara:strand:- start:1523 stop:2314 length:792 start_codon:yes stop_codon:yes gene_type:complete